MRSTTFHGRTLATTNRLLGVYAGMDGFKTGTNSAAGENFAGTAIYNGRRIITVVMGSRSGQRFPDTRALLDFGFAEANRRGLEQGNIGVSGQGWQRDNIGWWFSLGDGNFARGWRLIDGVWYFFNNVGYMQTGWLQDGGTWYFLRSTGAMATGWVRDGGDWYFLRPSGAMATGWVETGGIWYYLRSSGAMVTGMVAVDGVLHRFDTSGAWQGRA